KREFRTYIAKCRTLKKPATTNVRWRSLLKNIADRRSDARTTARGRNWRPLHFVLWSCMMITAFSVGLASFITLRIPIRTSLSAFLMLYQSYESRGYLEFLGLQAKDGTLREEQLPLTGWPRNRIKGWWRSVWVFPWFRQSRDLLEPWLLLPFLFTSMWILPL